LRSVSFPRCARDPRPAEGVGHQVGADHQRGGRAPECQGRAFRPRTPFRPHPDRRRARLRQAPRSEPILMRWKCSASGRTRPGWSATILNRKSWHPNGSAFTRSGTTVTASAYPATPRSGPTALSAACRNCCYSRASWCASRAVASLWFMAGTCASAQTGPGVGYDRAALTQPICQVPRAGLLGVAPIPWYQGEIAQSRPATPMHSGVTGI
jgi:hypothetical protein